MNVRARVKREKCTVIQIISHSLFYVIYLIYLRKRQQRSESKRWQRDCGYKYPCRQRSMRASSRKYSAHRHTVPAVGKAGRKHQNTRIFSQKNDIAPIKRFELIITLFMKIFREFCSQWLFLFCAFFIMVFLFSASRLLFFFRLPPLLVFIFWFLFHYTLSSLLGANADGIAPRHSHRAVKTE